MTDRLAVTLFVLAVLASLTAGVPVLSQAVRPDEPIEERAEARSYKVRIRIDPTVNAEPGECLSFDLDSLKVNLREKRVEDQSLLRLQKDSQPTLHVLLIDTSRSMRGHMPWVRDVARRYVEQLDTEVDRAMIATFDDSVVLQQGVTADHDRILESINGLSLGGATAMLEALYYGIAEVSAHRERPVVLLLTDGYDTGSFYERTDVWHVAEQRPDLSVFTIGLELPPIISGAPAGFASTRRFLQNLASATGGKFFDAPTPSRLDPVFRRIREMLDNEWTLFVIDPEPEAEPGKLKARSNRLGCKVTVLDNDRSAETPPAMQPITRPFGNPPRTLELNPDRLLRRYYAQAKSQWVDPACRRGWQIEDRVEDFWFAEVDEGHVRGCMLDLTMEIGRLYDHRPIIGRAVSNDWSGIKTRPFEISVPTIAELPAGPEDYFDDLARRALEVADERIETDPRRRPPEMHGRPYHDYPMLQSGRVFFDVRPHLAHSFFLQPEYRHWVMAKLGERAEIELEELKARFRRSYPDRPEAELDAAVLNSLDGLHIRRRAATPSQVDLQGYLAAWLGDVSAHDLFRRWEAMRSSREIAGEPEGQTSFEEEWFELRRIFFLPSYARVVTLLAPVHDPGTDAIGYWRIFLPRVSWFAPRFRGEAEDMDWDGIPLDMIPEIPLGHWVVGQLTKSDPALGALFRAESYRVDSVSYELLGKSGTFTPEKAFKETLVTVAMSRGEVGTGVTLSATVEMVGKRFKRTPRLRALQLASGTDPVLAERIEQAGANIIGRKGTDLFFAK